MGTVEHVYPGARCAEVPEGVAGVVDDVHVRQWAVEQVTGDDHEVDARVLGDAQGLDEGLQVEAAEYGVPECAQVRIGQVSEPDGQRSSALSFSVKGRMRSRG